MNIAIYSRKSKFTGVGESIENQIQLCKGYILNRNKNEEALNFLIYEDEGFSGKNMNRPEFSRLLADAKLRKFNILICYRLDRISRNVADFSSTLETIQKYSIEFISIKEQFDTSTPMGRAMIYIASVFAQLERETIAERVRDNMLELSKTGRWLGGTTPIGYDSEPIFYFDENMNERKMVKLKQVPEELQLVQLIYKKYLGLKSLSKVETFLLQKKYKTKYGTDFNKTKLRIILTNPVYVKATQEVLDYIKALGITVCGTADGEHGILSYNKSRSISTSHGKTARVCRDMSEWIAAVSSQNGIIDAADWLDTQKLICQNRNRAPNLGQTHNALLTGILKCSKCGSSMQIAHGHTSKKTGKKAYYYTCPLKKLSKGSRCNNKNTKVSELDYIIIKEISRLNINNPKLINALVKQNLSSITTSSIVSTEYNIKKSIYSKEHQIDKLIDKLSRDDDISDLILNRIKTLKDDLDNLKSDLINIKSSSTSSNNFKTTIAVLKELLNNNSLSNVLAHDELKELIHELINEILWNGNESSLEIKFKENSHF